MIKEEQLLFFKVLTVVIIILFINFGAFALKYKNTNITGFSIRSNIAEVYSSMPTSSKVFLFVQWGILILLLIFIAIRDKRVSNTKKEAKSLNLEQISRTSKTDLDTLYNLLKEKKKIKIATIARAFKIDKDLAMEWAKTLEDGKLAIVDYPSLGGPVLEIIKKRFKPK